MDQLIDSAARLHQALREQLKIAIDRRLGPGSWTWDELEARIQIVSRPQDGPGVDTYWLDREPLLRAHAIEAELHGRAVRFTRRIEHLMAGGDRQQFSD